jgi:hypothetical protein
VGREGGGGMLVMYIAMLKILLSVLVMNTRVRQESMKIRGNWKTKSDPRQAEVAQGVPVG